MIQRSHIWNSFFENIISGIQSFYIFPDVPLDIIRFFFNFRFCSRKSQSQQKLAKKITQFIIQFCLKIHTYFKNLNSLVIENNMLLQHSEKSFWLYKFSANIFLFGVRKNICTAPFLDTQELHSWSSFESKCLYISIYLLKKTVVPETK